MAKGAPTRARTVARILDAAEELFGDNGFHATSIEDICRHAGVSRSALYANFPGKDEVFLGLFDRHAAAMVTSIERATEDVSSFPEMVGAILGVLSEVSVDERRWALLSTEFSVYAARNTAAAAMLNDRDRTLRSQFRNILGRIGSEPSDEGVALFVRGAVALYEGAMLQSAVEGADDLPVLLLSQYARFAADRLFASDGGVIEVSR
ncbi:putative TetR family transcriptional regulator [Gordonia effusa NBRC 100432]|uniref:Putative TetR family transcriptional regulator n=1 Tax=Gordonia effusa NBRC 100432 TaxID=1077974 RepID=H0R6J8_9ACTN|nr:TetR/AcrR family transcriptional regulator [Gordonia effusa]GAB20699.1 putative TetR family transcriptional regulator [Gordonia effusa NBRC 100432]